MKHLLYALALAMPCVPLAAVAMVAAEPPIHAGDKPGQAPHHRQLIEVKFVLVSAPPKGKQGPYFDFGNGRAAIRPQPSWDRHARLLDGGVMTPMLHGGFMTTNMYWCSGWECRDSRH